MSKDNKVCFLIMSAATVVMGICTIILAAFTISTGDQDTGVLAAAGAMCTAAAVTTAKVISKTA